MNRNLIVVCAGLFVVVPALVCFSRATDSFDERVVTERFEQVPKQFGDWVANKPDEEDISAFKDEQYPGFMRRYENHVLGRQVLLLVRGGPFGPLVYHHHPQQCYEAIGFTRHQDPTTRRVATDKFTGEFATADFTKKAASLESLRIYWAWSGDGVWTAPNEPRLKFSDYKLLYRLYVVERTTSPSAEHEGSASEAFLKIAIPDINRALFGDK